MSKVVVIGAGASGIIASLAASSNNDVLLLEANSKIGKKLLLTGNGRCNYWNDNIECKYYNTDDVNNLSKILESKNEVFKFISSCGIYPKRKNAYYYPNSNQASTVVEVLNTELVKNNVNVVYNCKVDDIHKSGDKFIIHSNLDDIICDKVILSTGSCAYPKTGSDGSGYNILEKYHSINKVMPSLVALKCKGDFFADWTNIRIDSSISLQINGKIVDTEIGEVQLTDYGISGIPVFNISGKANKAISLGEKVEAIINFLPDVQFLEMFDERNKSIPNHTVSELMETILPYQLINILLKMADMQKNDNWNDLDLNKKKKLGNLVNSFNLEIVDSLSFDRSQVVTGGVSLKEINPDTMESLKVKDLYIVGELLDVDGKCGGYNLSFAFITGYIAGRNV